jgi:hypothetical protein
MPLPNIGANWIPVGNGVNDDSVPATVPLHFTPNRVELARVLLTSQDDGRLCARGCQPGERRDKIRQG